MSEYTMFLLRYLLLQALLHIKQPSSLLVTHNGLHKLSLEKSLAFTLHGLSSAPSGRLSSTESHVKIRDHIHIYMVNVA